MRKKRSLMTISSIGIFAVVMALGGLWYTGEWDSPVYAQDADDGSGSSTAPTPWGTASVSSIEAPEGGVPTPKDSGSNDNGAKDATVTPVTVSDITRPSGHVRVRWVVSTGDVPVGYRLERRLVNLQDPAAGWRVLAESRQGSSYRDNNVAPNQVYDYRITPILADGSTLASGTIRSYARQRVFLYGIGTSNGVQLTVRQAPNHPSRHQSVTITRYSNRELVNGTTLVSQVVYDQEFKHVSDNTAEAGTMYFYKMEVFYRLGDGSPWRPAPFQVLPVAVMGGVQAPVPPVNLIPNITDGTVSLTWSVEGDNKQTLLYEIQRRVVKPINEDLPESLGTTLGTTFTYVPSSTLVSYEYTVVPVNVALARALDESVMHVFPTLAPPLCYNPARGLDSLDVDRIYMFRDITADDPERLNRTFDVFGTDAGGLPCIGLKPADYYMERWIYFKHMIAPDVCPDPAVSCNMGSFGLGGPDGGIIDDPIWPTEIVYEAESFVWGFWKWRALSFVDNTLAPGKYAMKYRVCAVGFPDLCSRWEQSGYTYVGVTEDDLPFTVNPPPTSENRYLGTGILTVFPF